MLQYDVAIYIKLDIDLINQKTPTRCNNQTKKNLVQLIVPSHKGMAIY